MKKTLLRFALLVLLCMLLTTVCSAKAEAATLSPNNTVVGAEDGFIFGDVNLDGAVTNADALALFRYIYDPEQYPLPVLCNHTFGEWTVTRQPDCTTDGLQTRTCSKCLGAEEKEIAADHNYIPAYVPPTLESDGYIEHTCSNCGVSYQENTTVTDLTIIASNRDWVGYTGEADEELVIPAVFERSGVWYRITSIGDDAFNGCTSLASITIPDSVTSIGSSAFYNCTSLASVTIPDSVTSIANYAFEGCTSLTSITIPDSVTSIGRSAFSGCTSLASITIPDSVTSIGSSAFKGCTSLTSITIPDSVTRIGEWTFYDCTSLTSINIPDSVTSIGDYAFCDCTSLASITIPDSVTSIGEWAFRGCTSLASITIPDSVTSIGDSAFRDCTSLTAVYYTGTPEEWGQISIGSWNYDLTSATRYYYSETAPTDTTYPYWHYVNGVPTKW